MESLFSFLLFAGIFYLMMRFGCGTHMTHGHHDTKSAKNIFIDPVCGHEVEEDKGYGKLEEGHLYRFCSRECLDRFDREPGQFIDKQHSITPKDNEHET